MKLFYTSPSPAAIDKELAMRWEGDRESENVEDRRGLPVGGAAIGGGAGLLILLAAWFFGINPRTLMQALPPPQQSAPQAGNGAPAQDELKKFVRVVLADTEDVWNQLFAQMQPRMQYREPKLVLFTQEVKSACGFGEAAMGPFYCPGDEKVYIDLSFYQELKNRFHAPGEFAEAYVIAHEIGHHVQKLMGVSDRVRALRERSNETDSNRWSVRLELQADFLAGVWAHHAQKMKNILEPGDIESALNAASAIGDDRLQKQARGYVTPDSFTHGTSQQRVRWFTKGFQTGDIRQGDTFSTPDL